MSARRNLLLSGGPGDHPFAETSALLAGHLAGCGIESVVVDDPDEALERLAADRWPLLTVNALRWRMQVDRYAPLRDRWAFALDAAQEQALDDHVRRGGGLLAVHTAVICFDAAPAWRELLGAAWDWERSSHPPLGEVGVRLTPAAARHPVTAGAEDFTVTDEAYTSLDVLPGLVPLATVRRDGHDHPVLWTREVGAGRVVTDLLGHGPASMRHPTHHRILARAGAWACGGVD